MIDLAPPLIELRREVANIRDHLAADERLEAFIRRQLLEEVLPSKTRRDLRDIEQFITSNPARRSFDFRSFVISLFGIFETFIEDCMRSYLSAISAICPRYANLPPALSSNHLPLSLQLLDRLEQSRFRRKVSATQIIARLHRCMSSGSQYEINEEAFVYHAWNFREKTLNEYFRRVGVENLTAEITRGRVIQDYMGLHGLPGTELSMLNGFADLRNEVAHGTPVTIFSREIMRRHLEYFELLSGEIAEALLSNWAAVRLQGRSLVTLGNPAVIHGANIVGFRNVRDLVRQGDTMIARMHDGRHRAGEIIEIQVNGNTCDSVENIGDEGAAFRVGFRVKTNQSFFVVQANRVSEMVVGQNNSTDLEVADIAPDGDLEEGVDENYYAD